MGYPRALTVDPDRPGFYHCTSRCVRRAWLCGTDALSGRCFDHRRDWIEQRLLFLADSFAVGLFAWAVMSNHTHVVLRIDPELPHTWSDDEVARRWARLARTLAPMRDSHIEQRVRLLSAQPERLTEFRRRLGSLSWFMRFLNECIAREANAEDGCTGHFWEGRFKCQALLDDAAVTACMAYVDLNPIRAGIADELAHSDFTTIQRRLRALAAQPDQATAPLDAMAGVRGHPIAQLDLMAYIELVDCTG
ncbi:MAG: transposase, partial [Pseudomonadales bacterium]|nr:transposase [Pseudomonadales bacterium]